MLLQRCQFEKAVSPEDFRVDSNGACGPGIYAMLHGDKAMRKYYSARGEQTFSFSVPDKYVKKIGGRGVTTYQSIKDSISRWQEKGFKVFICKHTGINIPNSKQIIITDSSIITNIVKI